MESKDKGESRRLLPNPDVILDEQEADGLGGVGHEDPSLETSSLSKMGQRGNVIQMKAAAEIPKKVIQEEEEECLKNWLVQTYWLTRTRSMVSGSMKSKYGSASMPLKAG